MILQLTKIHVLFNFIRADSVTFNPHKMLTAPQQCSIFVTKHKNILNSCHSCSAQYLFQKDKFYDTQFDTGDKHIQCGRRADVMKFWLMWKAKVNIMRTCTYIFEKRLLYCRVLIIFYISYAFQGTSGLEHHVDHVFDVSKYFVKQIQNRPDFKLVLNEPECTNICFWYIPKSLRDQQHSPDYKNRLHIVSTIS